MNLKVLQWLIRHRDLLLQIVDVAKDFSREKPYIEQWDVVDRIARLVIPVLTQEDMAPLALTDGYMGYEEFDEYEMSAFSAGAEVQAMGIDWKQLIQVILPIVVAILEALSAKK